MRITYIYFSFSRSAIAVFILLLFDTICWSQSTGINNPAPDNNAALDIRAVGIQGILVPRHPGNVNASFALPGAVAQGLFYYDTLNQIFRFHIGNNVWSTFGPADNWGTQTAFTSGILTGNGLTGNRIRLINGTAANQVPIWDGAAWTIGSISGDNLGNHTATQNIVLGTNWLSGDGDNEGIIMNNTGDVSIGTSGTNGKLSVRQITTGYTGHFVNTTIGSSVSYGLYSGIDDGNFAGHFVRSGSIGTGPVLRVQNTNAAGSGIGIGLEQAGSGTAFQVSVTGTGRIALFDAPGGNDVYIANDGNLGLGVAAPTAQLHTTNTVRFQLLGGGGTQMVVADNLGVLSTQPIPTGNVTGSGAINKVAFWNSSSNIISTTSFHWDNTNENLGIGWSAPERNLHLHRAAAVPVFSKYTNTSTFVGAGNGFETGIDASGNVLFNNMENTYMSFSTSNTERMRITPSGFVGIGTTAPNFDLDIHSDGNGANIGVYTHWNFSNTGGILNLGFSRGTQAAPVTLSSGDAIGWVNFQGYNGSSYQTGAWIRAYSSEAWTTTGNGTNIDFMTRQIGSTTNSIRMTIADDGNIGIGTTTPVNKLDVEGGTVIGAAYSGTNTAPTNGLLVQGNVGIGTTTTSYRLDVSGEARVISTNSNVVRVESNNTWGTALNLSNTSSGGSTYQLVSAGSAHPDLAAGSFAISGVSGSPFILNGTNGDVSIGALTSSTANKIGIGVNPVGTSKVYIRNENNDFLDGLYVNNARSLAGGTYGIYCLSSNTTGTSVTYGIYASASGASTGTKYGVFGTTGGSGTRYGVYCSGDGAYTGTWTDVSDERLKKEINSYIGALPQIMKLRPKTYIYRREEMPYMDLRAGSQIGLIAQEVREVFPHVVTENIHPGPTDERGNPLKQEQKYLGVDYIQLVPILIKAVQEQQEIINNLNQRIESLEKK